MTKPLTVHAPAMGESIAEAIVAKWLVAEGEAVQADQLLAELETDKVNLEVIAPAAGVLRKIVTPKGSTVKVGDVMGELEEGAAGAAPSAQAPEQKPAAAAPAQVTTPQVTVPMPPAPQVARSGPAVQKLVAEGAAAPAQGSGKDGRITKADLHAPAAPPRVSPSASTSTSTSTSTERVPMSRIRKTIASRLKQAQNTAAMLTTYNEIDLHRIFQLRAAHKDAFEKRHGAKLGFMGFFTKAVVAALQEFPALNAEIDGEEIVYKRHYDIGIAVSSDRGLVVPVLREADALDLAGVEKGIADFGARARTGGLKPDELVGATFSITNGGVFGSMLSMPILNYPQVGILGMHAIKDRPVVVEENGQKTIAIRPVMYVALTYDHRIVDGREAVGFLVKVKELLEDPARFVVGV